MTRSQLAAALVLPAFLAAAPAARAQTAYIGFVYPAGGQQGTTFRVTLGGQTLEGVNRAFVSGGGVQAKVVEYNKRMNPQEIGLLSEQLRELRALPPAKLDLPRTNLIVRIQKIIGDNVNQPACASIANLAVVEVTVAPDAEPGMREIRLGTPRGVSNPLVFCVSQFPEVIAPPAATCQLVTLGKEAQSLRRKTRTPAPAGVSTGEMAMTMQAMMSGANAPSDVDDDVGRLPVPCVANGQITPGSVDRYCFTARKGQRLVAAVQARELIPYLADAVPGWFQPVISICDAQGREVAYDDDYRFKPDPIIVCEIPADGEYLLAIHDAIYRGREDFVYRLTLGEAPFVTSIFPLGGPAGAPVTVEAKGFNLTKNRLTLPAQPPIPAVTSIAAPGKEGRLSNRVPLAIDTLPECLEQEPNNQKRAAQHVTLPVIVNGRMDKPGDRDLFQFEGHAGEEFVAEVVARRLDSPLDSELKLTDPAGRIVAINDDFEDAGSGLNTHHADSYLRATLPTNGTYCVQLSDAQEAGGEEYGYRLRLGAPQPDFALRVVPSSLAIRSNSTATVAVYVLRKDGFSGPIKFGLKDPPPGFEVVPPVVLTGTQAIMRLTIKTTLGETQDPVNLTIEGVATNRSGSFARAAVPAEDRMQAFLWRHLVPALEFKAMVFNPPPPPPPPPKPDRPKAAAAATPAPAKPAEAKPAVPPDAKPKAAPTAKT